MGGDVAGREMSRVRDTIPHPRLAGVAFEGSGSSVLGVAVAQVEKAVQPVLLFPSLSFELGSE